MKKEIPIVGKKYHFFDDGKIHCGRHYTATVLRVVPFNEAHDIKGEDYSGKRFGYKIPDGYEFDVVVDGKIFIKPIKPKYPTTYWECCRVLGISDGVFIFTGLSNDEYDLFDSFVTLKRCRDAYWKIAGEKMGLGKPWKPQFENCSTPHYCIFINHTGEVCNDCFYGSRCLLAFPTAEMRDVFYENFKDLIEQCKELL